MSFKHTTDPWEMSKYGTKVLAKPKEKWMPIQPICFVAEVPMNREERQANCRLISAAPDLLQALQNLLEWPPGTVNHVRSVKDAEDAINKAIKK